MGCYVHIGDGRNTALVVVESKEKIISQMREIRNSAFGDKRNVELAMAASQITLTGFDSGKSVMIINPWSFISYVEEQDDDILFKKMEEWKAAQEAKREAMEKQMKNPQLTFPQKRRPN